MYLFICKCARLQTRCFGGNKTLSCEEERHIHEQFSKIGAQRVKKQAQIIIVGIDLENQSRLPVRGNHLKGFLKDDIGAQGVTE